MLEYWLWETMIQLPLLYSLVISKITISLNTVLIIGLSKTVCSSFVTSFLDIMFWPSSIVMLEYSELRGNKYATFCNILRKKWYNYSGTSGWWNSSNISSVFILDKEILLEEQLAILKNWDDSWHVWVGSHFVMFTL